MKTQEPFYSVWRKYKPIFEDRINQAIDKEIKVIEKEYGLVFKVVAREYLIYDFRFRIDEK